MITTINTLNEQLGRFVSWATLGMVLLMTAVVIRRYLFSAGAPWEAELVGFMHGMVFLLGAGYTLKHDAQVRVDVTYARFSARGKAWVNLLGTWLLLMPVCVTIIVYSWSFVLDSWAIYEASTEYHGMPGIFLFKSCVWLFAISLILQGLAVSAHAVNVLRGVDDGLPADMSAPHEPV